MSLLSIAGATPSDEGFELKSVRFDSDSDPLLTRTPTVDGNRRTWTFSCWVKTSNKAVTNSEAILFSAYDGSGGYFDYIRFNNLNSGLLKWTIASSGNSNIEGALIPTQVFRDPSAWMHMIFAFDSTQATAGNRMRMYVNGEEVTAFSTDTNPSLNYQCENVNTQCTHRVASSAYGTTDGMWDGYMAEAYFIDGAQLTPSSFAETNEKTNQWEPKNPTDIKPTLTFGTNGFYLPFSNDALAASFTDNTQQGDVVKSPDPSPNIGNVDGGQSYMYTQYPFVPTANISVDVLVVAGGAGGGGSDDNWGSGGGGAGGVSEISGKSVTADTEYVVKVGAGGAGGTDYFGPAPYGLRNSANGGSSSFDTIISNGGGYAGPTEGGAGGCGGAGSRDIGPSGDSNQGNTGGATGYGYDAGEVGPGGGGSGGGGAGQAGAQSNGGPGGNGGNGRANTWQTGSTQTYAGGGGGGATGGNSNFGNGGSGGGGNGGAGHAGSQPGDAAVGWGSGGGGNGGAAGSGGTGSAGIVIVRYQSNSVQATGGVITTYGSGGSQYYVHTFNHIPHTITASGDATNKRVYPVRPMAKSGAHIIGPKQGTSTFFIYNGATSNLSMADSADWMFGTGDFTLEMWVNTTTSSVYQYLMGQIRTDGTDECFLRIQNDSTWRIGFVGASGGISVNSTSTIPENTWTHLAAVRDGTTFRVYTNGVQEATNVYGTASQTEPTSPYYIGATAYNVNAANNGFYGYMDGIRISKGVCRYPNGTTFTPPTDAFTSDSNTVFLLQSGTGSTFTDTGNTGHTITKNGSAIEPWIAPKIGTGVGVYNPGGHSSSYINFNDGDVMEQFWIPGSSDDADGRNAEGGTITYETWVSFNAIPTNDTNSQSIYAQTYDNLSANYTRLTYDSGLKWRWRIYNSSDVLIMGLDAADTLSVNTWYHVAFVMDGKKCTIYRDGVEKGTQTMAGTPRNPNRAFEWGRYSRSSGAGNYMNGYMDESRISSSARYTENFTPSTTAFKADKDTLMLLHMDGGGGIDPETNIPTFVGQGTYFLSDAPNAIFFDTNGVPTNKSFMSFDGSGDKLSAPSSVWNDWNFGTNPFTFEAWVNLQDSPASADGADVISMYSGYNCFLKIMANHYPQFRVGTGNSSVADGGSIGTPLKLKQWYHLAAVRETDTSLKVYTDGILSQSATVSSANVTTTGQITLGAHSTNIEYLDAFVDQVRISNIARYKNTFTPTETIQVDMLVVGGGGGGGTDTGSGWAGGGGAGGVVVTPNNTAGGGTEYWVTVGRGGLPSENGENSVVSGWNYVAYGGGAGGDNGGTGSNGGSGGGGGKSQSGGDAAPATQGEDGADGTGSAAGGGGGAGQAGQGVNGGNGLANNYQTGTNITYAGGGGAGDPGTGGTGGGGNGNNVGGGGFPGADDLGGGGGGTRGDAGAGGYGGSGIVIIRYQSTTQKATGGEITTYGSGAGQYYVHTYRTQVFTPPTTPFTKDANTLMLVESNFSEGGLGADHSGNYNYWTPTNLTVDDSLLDSPSNNFATLNPLATQTTTLSEGNLKKTFSAAESSMATIGVNSGKWYWEVYPTGTINPYVSPNFGIGVTNSTEARMGSSSPGGDTTIAVMYSDNTQYTPNSTQVSDTLQAPLMGDVYGVALDVDAETLDFYQNGTKRFECNNFTIDGPFFPTVDRGASSATRSLVVNFGQDSSFAGSLVFGANRKTVSAAAQDSNDIGDFYYEPPAGYLALCTDNLPEPSIALPENHFTPAIYTGTGSAQTITTGSFQPDFTWTKNRSVTHSHQLYDSIRGATESLYSDGSDVELTKATALTAWTSTGFSVGSDAAINGNTNLQASWNWLAGGAASSNTDGTITSSVSANPTAGFSIVKYTGNATAGATVGHGLSQAPELIILRNYTVVHDWQTYAEPIGNTKYLSLNSTQAEASSSTRWNNTTPSASVITLGNSNPVNQSSKDIIIYCFHSVEGYSQVGKYLGNNSSDGPFIYTGFQPAFVIIKALDYNYEWVMFGNQMNPYNAVNKYLYANSNAAQTVDGSGNFDIISNGFKLRDASYNNNHPSGAGFLYYAVAEIPFKTSNAR